MLALCAAVTLRRPLASAYSKAASTIRSEPKTEIGLIEIPECSRISPAPSEPMNSRTYSASSESTSNSIPA